MPNAQVFTVPCPRCVAEFQGGRRDEDQIGEIAYQRVRLAPHERVGTSAKWSGEYVGRHWSQGHCSAGHYLNDAEWRAADTAAQREVNGE